MNVRLPGKGNSNSHGARPVHLIITMIKWIRTIRLSIKNSLSEEGGELCKRCGVPVLSASDRIWNNLKGFQDFYLKANARNWP